MPKDLDSFPCDPNPPPTLLSTHLLEVAPAQAQLPCHQGAYHPAPPTVLLVPGPPRTVLPGTCPPTQRQGGLTHVLSPIGSPMQGDELCPHHRVAQRRPACRLGVPTLNAASPSSSGAGAPVQQVGVGACCAGGGLALPCSASPPPPGLFNPNSEDPLPGQLKKQLVLRVISGQQLPKPRDSMLGDRGEVGRPPGEGVGAKEAVRPPGPAATLPSAQIIDPFVEVEVIGLPVDCRKEQTRVVDDNGEGMSAATPVPACAPQGCFTAATLAMPV